MLRMKMLATKFGSASTSIRVQQQNCGLQQQATKSQYSANLSLQQIEIGPTNVQHAAKLGLQSFINMQQSKFGPTIIQYAANLGLQSFIKQQSKFGPIIFQYAAKSYNRSVGSRHGSTKE